MVNNSAMNGKETRYVIKRSGEQVLFEAEKIKYAVLKAMKSIGEVDDEMAEKLLGELDNDPFLKDCKMNATFLKKYNKIDGTYLSLY